MKLQHVSGEPVTFTYWYPGEPNNHPGVEDYATIRHPSEVPPTGSWNELSDTSGEPDRSDLWRRRTVPTRRLANP